MSWAEWVPLREIISETYSVHRGRTTENASLHLLAGAMTPPSPDIEPTLIIPARPSLGLFGPRTPEDSPRSGSPEFYVPRSDSPGLFGPRSPGDSLFCD